MSIRPRTQCYESNSRNQSATAALRQLRRADWLPGLPGQAGCARPPLRRYACRLFAHKTGFSPALMNKTLRAAGFANVYIATGNLEVGALAFLQPPDAATRQKLGLPASG